MTYKYALNILSTTALVAMFLCGPAVAQDTYRLAFIPGVGGDAYYGSVACGIERAASEGNATVSVQAPASFSPSDQVPILQTVISQSPDAIIIAPTDSRALEAPLRNAAEQGITVVLVDTTLDDQSFATSIVTADNEEAGRVAGRKMSELLADGEGSVLTVNLSPGVTTTDARERGFAEAIQEAGYDYLGQQYSNNSVQEAEQIVSSALLANPDLRGIFSTAAFNTEGAVTAVRSAGRDDVTIIGFNANPPGVEQLRRGQVEGQVVLKPYEEGYQAGLQALNALNGEPVEKNIETGAVVATQANVDEPEVADFLYSFNCPD